MEGDCHRPTVCISTVEAPAAAKDCAPPNGAPLVESATTSTRYGTILPLLFPFLIEVGKLPPHHTAPDELRQQAAVVALKAYPAATMAG